MEDCIFCKIVKKEMPAHIVYEDEHALTVMDAFPHSIGQVLIIIKKHEPNVFHLDQETYIESMKLSKRLVKVIDKTFNTLRTCLVVEGFEVDHAHIKLFPCYTPHFPIQQLEEKPSAEELKKQASSIKENLNSET